MSLLQIEDLSFRYDKSENTILEKVNFSIHEGEFIALCGPSGSGKSTLLRHLKPELAPSGQKTGRILYEGKDLESYSGTELSSAIGYVMQQPDSQIVTDKVWHELAFGLENLGLDQQTIQRRVAETASYFGIQTWFNRDTDELSGGQKQLLNLASIMVMRPKLLVLDEPVSRLDPIAARDFIETIGRLNREMGMAVLIAEHNLEEVLSLCDRVVVIDEGSVYFEGTPEEAGRYLATTRHPMALSMPAPMRIYASCQDEQSCPVSVRQGHDWLDHYAKRHELRELPASAGKHLFGEERLKASSLWYRYSNDSADILRGASLQLYAGEWLAILGGNGSGKSTLLKILSEQVAPWRGKLKKEKKYRMALLPQEPKTMFRGFTVEEELDGAVSDELWMDVVTRCRLENLLGRHPYDLSGGEAQRAALAKVLLVQPDILLMDEPTKGLDAENKRAFAEIIDGLCKQGVAVLMVSHDLEFCAEHADYCSMLFDGKLQNEGSPRAFCADNHFYTTSAHRMASHRIPNAVTAKDVIYACGGEEICIDPPQKLQPPKRKKGVETSSILKPLPCSGKSHKADPILMALPILLFLTLGIGYVIWKDSNYTLLSLLILGEILICFLLSFEKKRPGAKEIAIIAILCALGVAGRSAFFMLPQFKPVAALVILCGVAYGPQTGFLVGAGTMLASNLFFGQGPWTPWQMCAMGLIGFLSGIIFTQKVCKLSISLWGGISVLIVYGTIMNLSSAIMYQPNLNWKIALSYIVSGIPFDLIHAGGTIIFLWILSEEFLKKLRRIGDVYFLPF